MSTPYCGGFLEKERTDPSAGIICEPVEVPLGDLVSGRCKLTFRQPGSFELKGIIGRVQSRLLVFGEDGVLVASDLTCEGYRSADLRSGSYQVVLMEPTELLVSVPELSVLDRYGLTAGQDYAKLDVTVTDGVISVIEQVQIPELDESKLFYTVPETTGMRLNPSAAFVDRCVMMRVEYELPEDIGASNETVYIHLPEGLQVMDNSLTVDNEPVSFIATDGTIRVPVNREKAVIHMYLQGGEVGTYAVDAELEFEKDGKVISQPLGSAELKLDVVFFRLPEQTSFSDLIFSGTALPDTTVTVYDGDEPVGTAVANGAGTWKAEVKLDNPYNYMPHSISVGVSGGALEKEIRTEPELLIYDGAIAEAVRVTMHNGAHETVFDFRDPTTDPYYTYQSRDYSFVVELNQPDDSRIEQVYVVTINGQGRTVYVECVYDPARNVWLGTHQYFGATDAPLGLDVEVIMKEYEGPILDEKLVEDVEQLVAEFEEEYDRQEEEYWKTLEETLVHPDFGKMTIDEVIIYVEGLQEETETLLNEIEEGQYKGLEAEGITVEEDDRGIRYSNDSASVRYRTEPLEKVDGAELEKEGYTAYKLTKNRTVYFRTNKNTIEYLDGEGKQKIICELDEILEGNDSLETISDIKDTLSLIKDVKEHQDQSGIDWAKFYKYHRDKARTNGIRAQVALQDLDEKIFNLEWENGDPDLIRKYRGQYDDLKFKEGLYELNADLYGSKFRYYNAMDKFGKACDFLDLASDIKDIGDTVHKGEVLQTVYKSLGRVCVGNEEYEIMEREIKVLNTSMNVSSASYAGASAAATVGTLLNVPVGVGVQVGVFAVKKFADYTHNKEYKRIGTRLKTLDCDGDGVPDYIEELMELGLMKNVIIDPSGYVYEAVPSNRLEGVKAEIYYRDGEQHILWDAANFDQVNPSCTDTEGRYHWDVPVGEWLVKYSKEGYLDTDSSDDPAANEDGYLPVPPPQMEVNVGMVSTAAPLVESMNVYQDQVQVIFSQYMKPATVRLTVSCGGKTVSGKLTPANAEYNEERTEQFATIFNFVPDTQLRGNATVTITEAVNYAGTAMTGAFVRTEAVQLRPVGLSMDKETGILYGEAAELTVQILPAEAGSNKTLTVMTSAPGIVDVQEQTVTTDGDGRAVIMVYGSLPGTAEVTVGLEGTDLKTSGRIRVELTKATACAKVTASIPNGSVVEAGTELELFTATAGAEIYYTLDGTCPCVVDSPSRIRYTGPIVLTEDTFLIAYAVKDGLEDSATTGFLYTVKPKPVNPFRDVPEGAWYYEPVMWALEKGITEGISETEFGSSQNCNRAQAVTFLWSAAGKPEPTATSHPFVDVPKGSFCEKAVLWAVEEGITSGTDATHFSPLASCNRATILTFLYHAFEDPDVSGTENPFSDVPDASWYTAPVLWAVEMGITAGTDATHFTPGATCMRAHMITFLYSAYNK